MRLSNRHKAMAWTVVSALLIAGLGGFIGKDPAQAADSPPSFETHVVSPEPITRTPQVRDGSVRDIVEVGSTVVAGGDFSLVRSVGSSSDISRPYIFAFDKATGVVIPTFTPQLDGMVTAILPGPEPGPGLAPTTVYVAGWFKNANNQAARLVLLDLATGQTVKRVTTVIDGPITTMAMAQGQLLIGGYFTVAGGKARRGLASFDVTDGASWGSVTDLLKTTLTENHNWSVPRDPEFTRDPAKSTVGVVDMDVDPSGTELVVVGNFQKIDDLDRDQVVRITLGPTSSSVRADWKTDRYKPACYYWAFDTYMRNVDWAPDGSYFAITTTGGPNAGTLCDSLSAWPANASGQQLQPMWSDFSGGDTLVGLEVTGAAVYAGGHQRWMNNPDGRDSPAAGAVPRAGISASDPRSGVPLSWNPGRHPRGSAAWVIKAASDGMWVGSDTDWYGYREVFRPRLAFFPIASGAELAAGAVSELPAYGYAATDSGVTRTYIETGGAGTSEPISISGLAPSSIRGMVQVDDKMIVAASDGYLYWGPLGTNSIGPLTKLDPYNDPLWSNLAAGDGSRTYRGVIPKLYGMTASNNQVSGIAYRDGRLYYTRAVNGVSDGKVYWLGFSPESGIVDSFAGTTNQQTLSGTLESPSDISVTSQGIVYVQRTTGRLLIAPLTGGQIGPSTQISGTGIDGIDWRGRGFTLGKGPLTVPNQDPVADGVVNCDQLDCTLDASLSSDEGTIVSYSWDLGDGTVAGTKTVQHTYAPGSYTAVLTVTDDRGGVGTKSFSVLATQTQIGFVPGASNGVNVNTKSTSVTIPAETQAGDLMVLSVGRSTLVAPTISGPTTWTSQIASQRITLFSGIWTAVADNSSAGSIVTVSDPTEAIGNMDVRVTVYRGVDTESPIVGATSEGYTNATQIVSPTVDATVPGSMLVSVWFTRSTDVTDLVEPAGVAVRGEGTRVGGGHINALVADSNTPVPTGANGNLAAGVVSGNPAIPGAPVAISFSLLLRAAL